MNCPWCDDDQAADWLDHVRVMHPDRWEDIAPARWPDGGFVVSDPQALQRPGR